jgi:predicted transcriptional regulator
MTNITLAIDDKLLKQVRGYAKRKGTTLNGLVRQNLTDLVSREERQTDALAALKVLMETSTGRLPKNYKFDREKLYESPALSRHKRTGVRSSGKAG